MIENVLKLTFYPFLKKICREVVNSDLKSLLHATMCHTAIFINNTYSILCKFWQKTVPSRHSRRLEVIFVFAKYLICPLCFFGRLMRECDFALFFCNFGVLSNYYICKLKNWRCASALCGKRLHRN